MPSTITTQSVIDLARTHVELMPLVDVGGFTSQPALSLLQDTMTEIFTPQIAWKWNRKTAPLLVTQQNRQDYNFAGAVAFVLAGSTVVGGVGIGLKTASGITRSGSTVTVNTLDAHNFSVGDVVYLKGVADTGYDSTETITPSSSAWSNGYTILTVPSTTSFTFTISGTPTTPTGASGITDFGYLESATMADQNETSSPRSVRYLQASRTLESTSSVYIPNKVTVSNTSTAGVLKVRFVGVPSTAAWGVTLCYQAEAPLIADLTGTWTPIPDGLAFMYRQIFIAQAYRYINSTRADSEYQKAQAALLKAVGNDDMEASDEYMAPTRPLMGGGLGF